MRRTATETKRVFLLERYLVREVELRWKISAEQVNWMRRWAHSGIIDNTRGYRTEKERDIS